MFSPLFAVLIIAILVLVFSVFLLFRENERLEHELRDRYHNPESLRHMETYQQIVEQAQWGIATRSADGQRIERCNPAFARLHGYDIAEMVDLPISDLMASDTPAQNRTMLREIHSKDHYRFESLHKRKDGSTFPALVDASVIRDRAGNILFRVINVLDITEQKEQSVRLARSEATLRMTLEKLPVGVWLNDAKGDAVYSNPEAKKILGPSVPKNPRNTDYVIRWTESGEEIFPGEWPLTETMRTGKPVLEKIMDFESKDGEIRTLVNSALPLLNEDRKIDGTIVMIQDITSIRKQDEDLKASKKKIRELAQHHERVREDERTRIAREIHDELGQHMTALRMDLGMMRMKHGTQSEELVQDIEQIKSAIDESIGVVRNIASDLRPKSLDMGFVAAARWLLTTLQKRSDIQFTLDVSEDYIELDDASATTAFRILQESLTNIMRHSKASEVHIQLRKNNKQFLMLVSDNGQGFNVEAATSKNTFGLMGIKERALMLGGHCDIVSSPGEGTSIVLAIPLTQNAKGADNK